MITPKPTRINPKKLLLSKWTAKQPRDKEKHFIVSQLLIPEDPNAPLVWIEIEAIYSHKTYIIAWRELKDASLWLQGWH